MTRAIRTPVFVRLFAGALLAVFAVFATHSVLTASDGPQTLYDAWMYDILIVGAGIVCLARAAYVREERVLWAVMGLGILSWAGGEIYWSLELSELDEVPYPSLADGLYLGYYPAAWVTLMGLVHVRLRGISRAMWLDGAIGAVAMAAIAAAVVFNPVMEIDPAEKTMSVLTTLAYPVGDLVLLALVVGVFGVSSWRPGRTFALIGLALAVSAVADGVYLVQEAEGTYVEGGLLDVLWVAAALLTASAAWQPIHQRDADFRGVRVVLFPLVCGLAAIGLIAYSNLDQLGEVASVLGLATLLLVTLRMALSFRENQRMLEHSRTEALTDSLTGLSNRRRLMQDLELELHFASVEEPRVLVLFDLDGFKLYNDSYGHPAGDALLARLGRRLGQAVEPYGSAYRLGGDEFCALFAPGPAGVEVVVGATSSALQEHGEGFEIGCSHGEVIVPLETGEASEALQLADRRMYAQKGGKRASAGRQTRDVLLSTLRERQPELHMHLRDVAEYALSVGRMFGLTPEELDELGRAAELHDVGKIAIPDAILEKPGPLDEEEWAFMRRHTIIGERILGAAPALRPVGRIVRSSHERFDGGGYPDGVSGEEIPLGSRIVSVCDAFDAMTSERPYRTPLEAEAALAELRRCAGAQFDPSVVDAFVDVATARATTSA